MLDNAGVAVAAATVLGFLAGIGVGGGSLMILWLTLAVGIPPETARQINLLFFLPAASVSSVFRIQHGSLPWKNVWPAILSGCAGALLGYSSGQIMTQSMLKKAYGILLLFTGVRELLYKKHKQAS